MDGNLQVAYDIDVNFVTAWNEMFVDNDFLNPSTGKLDPRHMYGSSNFDVFRWPSLEAGPQKSLLATFIAALVMPGIPLVKSFCFDRHFFSLVLTACPTAILWRRTKLLSLRQWCKQLSLWVSSVRKIKFHTALTQDPAVVKP